MKYQVIGIDIKGPCRDREVLRVFTDSLWQEPQVSLTNLGTDPRQAAVYYRASLEGVLSGHLLSTTQRGILQDTWPLEEEQMNWLRAVKPIVDQIAKGPYFTELEMPTESDEG